MSKKGFKHSAETKQKMRLKALGRKHTKETKAKLSLLFSGENHPYFGKTRSKETKQKISLINLGRKHTTLARANMSLAHRGYKVKEETKQKIRNFFIGKKLPEEHKRKISDSKIKRRNILGYVNSKETREKMRIFHTNHPNRIFKDTSIEKKIKEELIKRNILFEQNKPVKGIANVDFLLSGLDIIIQCDGCYYHGCPRHHPNITRTKKRDTWQTQKLTEAGYKVFRFWEHEINQSPVACVDKVFS